MGIQFLKNRECLFFAEPLLKFLHSSGFKLNLQKPKTEYFILRKLNFLSN